MIDLTGHYDVPVPEEVLAELAEVCKESNVEMLVIGAAARDLVIHSQQQKDPIRATDDVDIAVAVRTDEQFLELAGTFARRGKAPHKFKVLGVEVDIVPFGGNEADRTVTFTDGNLLDVTGLQEAHLTSPSSSMRCLKVHSMMRSGTTTKHLTLPMPTSSQRPVTTTLA